MAINNDAYFNAALIGAVEGMLEGRPESSATAADYAGIVTNATTFATALDALIAEDATVSTGAGDASCLAGSTSTIVFSGRYKPMLLQAICRALFSGRNFPAATASASFATMAAAAKAANTQAAAALSNAA